MGYESGFYFNLHTTYIQGTTAGVMKTVRSVYTILINTIHLPHSTQVAGGTIFKKYVVLASDPDPVGSDYYFLI